MKDKTNEQLTAELARMSRQIAKLKKAKAELKRVEMELRKEQRRFNDVAENALEWFWEVNTHGKYTYASPAVEKILGYKAKEVLGKPFYELFHPEDREELKLAAFEAFALKDPFREFVNRNIHKNGSTVWLSTSGVPILDKKGNLLGYRGADIDITEFRKVEAEKIKAQAAAVAAQMALATIEGMIDIVLIMDLEGGIIQFNGALTEILGWGEEVLSKSPAEFVIQKDMPGLRKGIKDCVEKGCLKAYECAALTKGGKEVPLVLNASIMRNSKGDQMAIVAVLRENIVSKRERRPG